MCGQRRQALPSPALRTRRLFSLQPTLFYPKTITCRPSPPTSAHAPQHPMKTGWESGQGRSGLCRGKEQERRHGLSLTLGRDYSFAKGQASLAEPPIVQALWPLSLWDELHGLSLLRPAVSPACMSIWSWRSCVAGGRERRAEQGTRGLLTTPAPREPYKGPRCAPGLAFWKWSPDRGLRLLERLAEMLPALPGIGSSSLELWFSAWSLFSPTAPTRGAHLQGEVGPL